MSDRMKLPPEKDCGFYQRRKHDKWREVAPPDPPLEGPVADSHAHVHSLPDPAWELVRCAANNVRFICEICDPSEDTFDIPGDARKWQAAALEELQALALVRRAEPSNPKETQAPQAPRRAQASSSPGLLGQAASLEEAQALNCIQVRSFPQLSGQSTSKTPDLPIMRITAGVHPHNAKLYDDEVEKLLMKWLEAPETVIVGEIGLDYHYDLSPRDVQRKVFRRQIQIAKELDMPISLHLRGGDPEPASSVDRGSAGSQHQTEGPEAVRAGETPVSASGLAPASEPNAAERPAPASTIEPPALTYSNAHREAFEILQEVGFPSRGTILHCCALPPEELQPWVDAGCYIAYGGTLTFKTADAAREGARIVPADQLLLETDSPYMAPEPMRGAACTPAHVIFSAARLAEIRGIAPGPDRERFLAQLMENTRRIFGLD